MLLPADQCQQDNCSVCRWLKEELITALYCRLSVDDDNKDMESNSITNQKQILQDFARREGYRNTQFFVDDGVSGTTFQREGFQQMQKMVEDGLIGTIIVKDLSHFGREQVEMGRLIKTSLCAHV